MMTDYGVLPHKERMDGRTYCLSYGGGVNSTAMVIELVKRGYPLDNVVFADPGFERPETYDFVNNYMAPWLRDHGIPFSEVVRRRPTGERETIIQYFKRGFRVPDRIFRDCTKEQKIRPIHKFYKHQLRTQSVIEYIGISSDEPKRVKESVTKWIIKCYPLVAWRIDRAACKKIIEAAGLPIPSKSGCPNCFASKKPELYDMWKNNPKMFETAIEIEDNYLAHKTERGLTPYYYMTVKGKPTALRDLKKEFENTTTMDSWLDDEPDNDESCIGGCMT